MLDINYFLARAGINSKQDLLVSGTNIKTINNESLLGSGNITISGGGSLPPVINDRFLHTNTSTGALEWAQVDMSSKINVNQGVAHAGQFLVVGQDGNVTTQTLQTYNGEVQ